MHNCKLHITKFHQIKHVVGLALPVTCVKVQESILQSHPAQDSLCHLRVCLAVDDDQPCKGQVYNHGVSAAAKKCSCPCVFPLTPLCAFINSVICTAATCSMYCCGCSLSFVSLLAPSGSVREFVDVFLLSVHDTRSLNCRFMYFHGLVHETFSSF